MAKEIFDTLNVDRIVDGPKGSCGGSKAMQINREPEGNEGPAANGVVDRSRVHEAALVGGPQPVVLCCPRYSTSELVEIQIDPSRHLERDWKVERTVGLSILLGDFEHP